MRPLIILIGLIGIVVGVLLTVTRYWTLVGIILLVIGIIVLCLGLFTHFIKKELSEKERRFVKGKI